MLKLNSSQSSFYQLLKKQVHQKDLNFWIFFSERYVKTEKPYIGAYSYSQFEIKKRTGFWGSQHNHTIATGKCYEQGDNLRVEVSLGVLPSFVQVYLISALLGILTVVLIAPRLFEGDDFKLFIGIFPIVFLLGIVFNLSVYRNKRKKFEKEFNTVLESLSDSQ